MKKFWLHIVPQGPLALNDETDETTFQRSREAIPGGTLRGALAAQALQFCTHPAYLDRHPQCPAKAECPFWQLFHDDALRFGDAYPAYRPPQDAFPLPLTAHTCKTAPGLPWEGEQPQAERAEPPHGVWDLLMEQFLETLRADPAFPLRPRLLGRAFPPYLLPQEPSCPICGADLTPATGLAYLGTGSHRAAPGRIIHRWQAHVGINRARFAAQPGLFFVQELTELPRGWAYYAPLWIPEDREAALRQVLSAHPQAFVGGGRSRGYGRVQWQLVEDMAGLPPLKERLTQWDLLVRSAWARVLPETDFPSGAFLPLTLRSPALWEDWGRPRLLPHPQEVGLPEATLLMAWTRPTTVTGWHEAAHLPLRTRQAAVAGSVYLFYVPRPWSDLLPTLEDLEARGTGLLRSRGLGEMVVAHPWHVYHAWTPASASL